MRVRARAHADSHTHSYISPKQAWQINKTFLCDQQLQWNLASQKLDEHSMLYFTNTLKSWITTLPYVQYLYPPPMLPLLQRDLQWLVFRCLEDSLIFWGLFVKELTTCPGGRLEDLTIEQTGLVAQGGILIFLIIPCLDCPSIPVSRPWFPRQKSKCNTWKSKYF